jgi:regulator of protease activity HflC (stomatin/prohibitin superfamily)
MISMKEARAWKLNGFVGLLLLAASLALAVLTFVQENIPFGIVLAIVAVVMASSITVVQPNQAVVVNFFGRYLGSIRQDGLWMTIPFSARKSISLRVRNFDSSKLKVNDIEGNSIEIAAVIVFRVIDSAKATFDVDSYEQFVKTQSETALRHVASKYPYDNFQAEGYSLRGNAEEVSHELSRELQERLNVAGVEVLEARLTHLAYSTEIASAMLQRQQASAILAARQIIVDGAVGMVQMALAQIEKDASITLDDERKAAMMNNLMVAIVSDRSSQPVVNVGSLY